MVDGKKAEGSWRSHQVPFSDMNKPEHVALLEEWMRSYKPEELSMRRAVSLRSWPNSLRPALSEWARTCTRTADSF